MFLWEKAIKRQKVMGFFEKEKEGFFLQKAVIFLLLSFVFCLIFLIFLRGNADFIIFRLRDGADDATGNAIRHVPLGECAYRV